MKSLNDIHKDMLSQAGKAFAVLPNEILSYSELSRRINLIGGLYKAQNVTSGARVVICSADESFVITATTANLLNGVASIVLTPETTKSRAIAIIQQAKPDLLFIDQDIQAIWQLSDEYVLIPIEKNTHAKSSLMSRFRKARSTSGWHNMLNSFAPQPPALPSDLSQLCFINFTSGTTGSPKGVQITYGNLLSHLATLSQVFDYDSDSRILNNMVLAHADGLLQGPILALYQACTLYRPFNMDVQHLEPLLNTVYQERISHMLTVPTVLSFIDRLAQHDDYFESEQFKHLISVAGMLDSGIWQRLEQRFNQRICNIYGLTETVAGGVFCGPGDDSHRIATIGKPVDMSIRIVDSDNNQCDVNEHGELQLKGDAVFTGYYGDASSTNACFDDGWFKTGDIASLDCEGFVHLHGRSKELIISGGFNIHPAEVNEALLKHPAVIEAATLGMPDPEWQEVVISAVVLASDLDTKDLTQHCRLWLEPKKIPRDFHIVPTLPKGDAGKVNLPELRRQLNQTKQSLASEQQSLSEDKLISLAAETFQVAPSDLSLQSKVGETPGWDSLGHLMFIVAIEQAAGIKISAQQIMTIETLADAWDLTRG